MDSATERNNSLRKEILFQLYAVRPSPRTPAVIINEARKQHMDFTMTEIQSELEYLTDQGLLIPITMSGTSERLYRIHANGVNLYEREYSA